MPHKLAAAFANTFEARNVSILVFGYTLFFFFFLRNLSEDVLSGVNEIIIYIDVRVTTRVYVISAFKVALCKRFL